MLKIDEIPEAILVTIPPQITEKSVKNECGEFLPITAQEAMDLWLTSEGIHGYTDSIISNLDALRKSNDAYLQAVQASRQKLRIESMRSLRKDNPRKPRKAKKNTR